MSAGIMSNSPGALALGEPAGLASSMDLRSPSLRIVGQKDQEGLGLPNPAKLAESLMSQLGAHVTLSVFTLLCPLKEVFLLALLGSHIRIELFIS
jgi:hypothetical protein